MTNAKQAAGRRAAEFVTPGSTVGLGTGSTVLYTLQRLGERIGSEGLEIRGVPTSLDTERKARELGIPLVGLDEVSSIDLTIDGADEIDGDFDMIKGGGGALLREKVVASISEREVIVVGRAKVVERLGLGFLLPVEVVPFARPVVSRALAKLGAQPTLRLAGRGPDRDRQRQPHPRLPLPQGHPGRRGARGGHRAHSRRGRERAVRGARPRGRDRRRGRRGRGPGEARGLAPTPIQ